MKRLVTAVSAVAVLMSFNALAQSPPSQPPAKPGAQAQEQAKQTGIQLPPEEQKFVQMMHANNQKEIRLGQLAEQKAQNQQVRDFGKRMVQDHQQADKQLQQLAQKQKWRMQEPRPQNARERASKQYDEALEAKLRQLDGAAFDQAFMSAMVADHDEAVARSVMAQSQYQNPELVQMIGQMTPKLAQHREEAYRVLGQISAPSQLGVGGAGGMGSGMEMGGTQEGRRAPMRGGQDSTNREGTLSPSPGTAPDARGGQHR